MDTYRKTMLYASEKSAIGYVPVSSIYFHRSKKVKILGLKPDANSPPVFPDRTAVVEETMYPVTLPFYYYWNKRSPKITVVEGFAQHSPSIDLDGFGTEVMRSARNQR